MTENSKVGRDTVRLVIMNKWLITNSVAIVSESIVSRSSLYSEDIVIVKRHSLNEAIATPN